MLATHDTQHTQEALSRLMEQYKGLPLYEGFYRAFLEQIQEIEDATYELDADRQLWNGSTTPAIGKQLDNIGTLVGASRNGLPDDEYVLFLFGKIAENTSDTTMPTILSVVGYLFQADQIFVQDKPPAGVAVEVVNPRLPQSLFPIAKSFVQNALGAGISLIIGVCEPTNCFRFMGPGVDGAINGFGDVTVPGIGGVFAGVV